MIENYGDVGALSIFVGVMVWYLKYTTRQQAEREKKSDEERLKREEKRDVEQKEERNYYRKVIDGGMQKNAILNTKSLTLQKGMMKDLKDHNGHTEKFSEKVVKTLSLQTDAITLVCNRLNGGSSSMVEAKRKLNKDRRKIDEKVEINRRKA
jgi:hypothetical protein